jgi:hypothetical protein
VKTRSSDGEPAVDLVVTEGRAGLEDTVAVGIGGTVGTGVALADRVAAGAGDRAAVGGKAVEVGDKVAVAGDRAAAVLEDTVEAERLERVRTDLRKSMRAKGYE